MTAHTWRGLRRAKLPTRAIRNERALTVREPFQLDSRNRLSKFWAPTGGISSQDGEQDASHALLVRGGFLRQAHSGVFHLLPLGHRVQSKLGSLIDKHMSSLGASKVSLSSITTESLWRKSGRYSANSELLRLKDRKESGFLLSPTHEEEITALVAETVHSYKDVPLRLYQIGRKYRDERRPRGGLLRAKEFEMKDLYTFDSSKEQALETYEAVRATYTNIFNELKVPYLVADADSGNMGGKLSHEYHFVSPKGEDNVWSCNSCDYIANEELVEKKSDTSNVPPEKPLVFTGISSDRKTKIVISIPRSGDISSSAEPPWSQISSFVNLHAIKNAGIDLDTGIETSTLQALLPKTTQTISIYDQRISQPSSSSDQTQNSIDLTITRPGDHCPRCSSGSLSVQKAIEVGHTFHLGTRYSAPLDAVVALQGQTQKIPLEMGCHGIGVSRIIGAVASLLSDTKGLNWPRVIAPFEVVVVYSSSKNAVLDEEVTDVYDSLNGMAMGQWGDAVDTVVDDRPNKSLSWKLNDADLIGYPVIVVLGKAWRENREVEVQCRRLGVRKNIQLGNLRDMVRGLLEQL